MRKIPLNFFTGPPSVYSLLYLAISFISSLFFGTRLFSELGSDFGVYFVGALSIREDFSLYGGFFDHKGPLYYAFIKLLGFFVPYSLFGASLVLFATCLGWFLSIIFSAKLLKIPEKTTLLLIVIANSALVNQPSNASIGIFQASLGIIFLAFLKKYKSSEKFIWFFLATFSISCAILTRIDAVLFLPIIFYFIGFRKVVRIFVFISFVIVEFLILLSFLAFALHFSFADFWNQAVIFNFTTYADVSNSLGFNSHLWSIFVLFKSLCVSGLVLVLIYVFFSLLKSGKIIVRQDFIVLFSYGLTIFVVVGSSKDYHRFIFYVFFIAALFSIDLSKLTRRFVGMALLSLVLISSVFLSKNVTQSKCIFANKCPNPYQNLVRESDSVSFFINQGWPYLFSDRYPDVAFTSYFPLLIYIQGASEKVIADANGFEGTTIVLVKSDYLSLVESPDSLIKRFLSEYGAPQELVHGYLHFNRFKS